MRKAALALALAATQLTVLSGFASPAFAQGTTTGSAAVDNGPPAAENPKATDPEKNESHAGKKTTGWVLVGVGGALGIAGIVVDVVGANAGHVAGSGAGGDGGQTDNSRTDLLFVGTSLIVAGLVSGIYGGALIWSADHGGDTKTSTPTSQQDDAKADGATKAAQAKLASAPSFVIPVLSAKF